MQDERYDAVCGEVDRHVATHFRAMLVGAGICCTACGHPWALLHMIFPDGSKLWTGYCPDPHAEGCSCGHNRTSRTLRALGVPPSRRLLVALGYYLLGEWREEPGNLEKSVPP